jgi:competence protein ComEC
MPNWREYPFFRILLPFLTGILSAIFLNLEIPGLDAVLASLLTLLLLYSRIRQLYRLRWLYGCLLCLLLLALGYRITWHHHELNHPNHFSHLLPADQPAYFRGSIREPPLSKGKWTKAELKILAVAKDAAHISPASGYLLLYLPLDSLSASLEYGDTLAFFTKTIPIPGAQNPGAFDYRRHLHFKNIHRQAFPRANQWRLSGKMATPSLYATALRLQRHFTSVLAKHLGKTPEYAVGAALILGYRSELPEELLSAYSETGAMHVLAVSGLHAGIVFLMLNFFLKRVPSRHPAWRLGKTVLLLTAIWSYALVTGASPSVVRAVTMFSFAAVGEALDRNKNFYNTLYASAFFLLCYNPYWLASISFQLSYLAVFGIVYFQPLFAKGWILENKWLDYCWQLSCVSMGAQLATLPLTLYYFHQFPSYFWLSGLVLVPLSGVELGLGLGLLLLESLWPPAAVPAGSLLQLLLWLGNESTLLIQQLPMALLDNIRMGSGSAALLYLSLVAAMYAISFRRGRWLLAALALLLFVCCHHAALDIRQANSRQLLVYHLPGHTLIDFFDGTQAYTLQSAKLDPKRAGFAAKGYRCTRSANFTHLFHLEDSSAQVAGQLFRQGSLMEFSGIRLAMPGHLPPGPASGREKTAVDYLLLTGSPALAIEDLMDRFSFKMIIFDASNKKNRVAKWKAACKGKGIPCFDLQEKGAFVLELPPG